MPDIPAEIAQYLPDRPLLSFEEVAGVLGVSKYSIYRYAKENGLPVLEINARTLRVRRDVVAKLITGELKLKAKS